MPVNPKYRPRQIGCHVILKATEEQVSEMMLGIPGAILEFPINTKLFHQDGVEVTRKSETEYVLRGYENFEIVNAMKIPEDLLKLSGDILEKNLYVSLSFRHEELDLTETVLA